MCLINFHLNDHPQYKLIIAANRDEFYSRPTANAHFWEDKPHILAGRDLMQRGTWLGISRRGRIAALTNYRDPTQKGENKISRGAIVTNYLASNESPQEFLESLKKAKDSYVGFNVLAGNPDNLYYYNNIQNEVSEIAAGTHGLSNHFLNTPWPKVTKGKKLLHEYVMGTTEIQANELFKIVSDAQIANDEDLPRTGVDLNLERKLSPLFIQTPEYGTRSSTVLLVDNTNNATFVERTYEKSGFTNEKRFEFHIGV